MLHLDKSTIFRITHYLEERLRTPQNYLDVTRQSLSNCDRPFTIDFEDVEIAVLPEYLLYALLQYGNCQNNEHSLYNFLRRVNEIGDRNIPYDINSLINAIKEDIEVSSYNKLDPSDISIFISYSHSNTAIVKRIVNALIEARYDVWFDEYSIEGGSNWKDAIVNGIKRSSRFLYMASPLAAMSPYVNLEIDNAKTYNIPSLPIWIEGDDWKECSTFEFTSAQYFDLRTANFKPGLLKILYELSAPQPSGENFDSVDRDNQKQFNILYEGETKRFDSISSDHIHVPKKNPFIGLNAFTEETADNYYGREEMIGKILNNLHVVDSKQSRFHTIAGASGSGKSSLVQAGILPALKSGSEISGSQKWTYLKPMRPGSDPITALLSVLENLQQYKSEFAKYRSEVDSLHEALLNFVSQLSGEPLILYIDQFEELFTQVKDEELRKNFIEIIVNATYCESSSLVTMITIRADFLESVLDYQGLSTLVFGNLIPMQPVEVRDLLTIIRKPVKNAGVFFQEDLEILIVSDMIPEKSPLPLLQFTMQELFEKRAGNMLTLNSYTQIQGSAGAIANHAENQFIKLSTAEEQKMLRGIFLRLIELNSNDTVTRKTVPLESFVLDKPDENRLLNIINLFITQRLLTIDNYNFDYDYDAYAPEAGFSTRHNTSKDVSVTISHESIVQRWPRFTNWIKDHRLDLVAHAKIHRAYQNWEGIEDDEQLLPENLVDIAEDLADQYLLGYRELNYVKQSRIHQQQRREVERKRKEEVERIEAEIERIRIEKEEERKINRRRIQRAGIAFLITTVIFAVALVLILQRDNAQLRDEANYIQAQVNWLQQRVPGLGGEPLSLLELTQTPQASFLATATAGIEAIQDVITPTIEIDTPANVEMVYVPAGCFWMGSYSLPPTTRQNEVREICIPYDFWIDRYEVTHAQIADFAESYPPGTEIDYDREQDNYPISSISMINARIHCETRNARLPMEREWEYAARGLYSRAYTWGNNLIDEDSAFFMDDMNNPTLNVPDGYSTFSILPSGVIEQDVSWVGAFDMNTNVSEITTIALEEEVTAYVIKGSNNLNLNSLAFLLASGQEFSVLEQENKIPYTGLRCVRLVNP